MVRLHPLAVILVLAVGGVIAGIAGAVVAVPITAALSRAIPELRAGDPDDDAAPVGSAGVGGAGVGGAGVGSAGVGSEAAHPGRQELV
jgi:hypothetical protein